MKLHPLSITYRSVETLLQIIPLFVLGGVVLGTRVDGPLGVAGLGTSVLMGLIAIIVYQAAYYQRYEYVLTDSTFDIYSGVLSRRHREVPYRRIQNVSINRNVIQRLFGLAILRLETAGGEGAEVDLRYVSEEEANRLQDEVSRRKRGEESTDEPTGSVEESADRRERTPLYSISRKELALLGIVSFDVRLVPLSIIALSSFSDQLQEWFVAGGYFYVRAPLLALLLYLVSAAFSGLYAVSNYYSFRLWQSEDELRYERGLLQRFSGTIPLEKIQTIAMEENVLQRLLGYASIQVETAGFSPDETGGSQSAVPLAERERAVGLARDIESYEPFEFERPPKRARERYAVRYLGVVGVLVALAWAGAEFTPYEYGWEATAALVAFVPIAAHFQWRHRGYVLLDDHVVTRNGFWSQKITIVPYHRIQTVIGSQTIFQRRRQLATLTIDTAGASGLGGNDSAAVDIDADLAEELREEVTDRFRDCLDKRRDAARRRRREQLLGGGAGIGGDGSERSPGGAVPGTDP